MKAPITITVLLLVAFVQNASCWWFWRSSESSRTSSKCNDPVRGNPFYFGTTDLRCRLTAKRGKRQASPSRSNWSLVHRWIEYDGYYFERLKAGDVYHEGSPVDSVRCRTKREQNPAGYSRLSIECMKACTRSYKAKFGRYQFLFNNCNHFANTISDVLCSYTTCPSWC